MLPLLVRASGGRGVTPLPRVAFDRPVPTLAARSAVRSIAIFGYFVLACAEQHPTPSARRAAAPRVSGAEPPLVAGRPKPSASERQLDPTRVALRGALDRWFDATNSADTQRLSELYAPKVQFYGLLVAREKAVTLKRRTHTSNRSVEESLVGEPTMIRQMHDHWRIEFTKRVSAGDASTDYQAYLTVKTQQKHEIVEESDRSTEVRLGMGECEFVMRRTLAEFCGVNELGVSGAILESSPEVARPGHAPEPLSSYSFAVGTSSTGGDIFHTFGRVRLSPDTGAVELECPSRWPWRWEHLCDALAPPGAPPRFYPVAFVPTMKPSDDRACATVVRHLKERPALP
jgi:hypothetical protein